MCLAIGIAALCVVVVDAASGGHFAPRGRVGHRLLPRIAPVDLAQAVIGRDMAVHTRYARLWEVLEVLNNPAVCRSFISDLRLRVPMTTSPRG